MSDKQKQQRSPQRCLGIILSSLILWGLCIIAMAVMLINDGFDQIILNQPFIFFSLLATSVFLLATGINHLISYYQMKHRQPRD